MAIERRFLTHLMNTVPFIESVQSGEVGARIVKSSPYLHTLISNNRLYVEKMVKMTTTTLV